MPRDAVSRTANVGTAGTNGLRTTVKYDINTQDYITIAFFSLTCKWFSLGLALLLIVTKDTGSVGVVHFTMI